MSKLVFRETELLDPDEVLDALARDNADELRHVPFSIGLYEPDFDYA